MYLHKILTPLGIYQNHEITVFARFINWTIIDNNSNFTSKYYIL